jgi:hypothetical protein
MDESSGTTIGDSSENNNTGNSTGTSVTTGKFGNGRSFSALGNRIETSLSFVNPNSLTYSTWVKTNSTGTKQWIICPDNGGWDWSLLLENGKVALMTGLNYWDSTYSITTDWTHIAVVFDYQSDGKAKLYINGVLISNSASLGPTTTGSIAIGNYYGAAYDTPFSGVIDETRIYNRALSPKEVTDLYNFAPGPIGYWDFEDGIGQTFLDRSGNGRNGSFGVGNSAPVWSNGKYGKGLNFNGGNQYALIPNTVTSGLRQFNIGFWVNTNESRSNGTFWQRQSLFGMSNGGAGSGDFGITTDNGYVGMWSGLSGTDDSYLSTTLKINDKKWHYISVSNNGISESLYVDGIYQAALNTGSALNGEAFWIGGKGGSESPGSFHSGIIDEVKIYNYARTSHQIIEDMNGGHPLGGSPVGSQVAYWTFDEGYGTVANNSGSGGSLVNGVINGGVWSNDGKQGKSVYLNNALNNYVISNSPVNLTGDQTFSIWVYPKSTDWLMGVITTHNYTVPSNIGINIFNSNYALSIGYASGSREYGSKLSNKAVVLNAWTHLVLKYVLSENSISLYINGVLDSKWILTEAVRFTPEEILIGQWSNDYFGAYKFNGLVDEVKVYNAALSDDEIKLDYNQGQAIQMGSLSSGAGNTAPSNAASQEYCVPGDTASCAPPVGEWKFEEGVGSTAYDTSGNNLNGSIIGAIWSGGKNGKALNFRGEATSNYISTTYPLTAPSSYTAEAWIKPNSVVGTGERSTYGYAIMAASISGSRYPLWITVRNGEIRSYAYSNSTASYVETVGANILPNQWSHVTVTAIQNGNISIYVNGKNLISSTAGNTSWDNTDKLTIGDLRPDRNISFNGIIDNARIFDYARTPAQIAWDYNKGGPVAYWDFDECQGNITHDLSGNNLNGTINVGAGGSQASVGTCTTAGTAWGNGVSGKFNSSLNFDGTDDYTDVPVIIKNYPFSISGWIKSATQGTEQTLFAQKNTGGGPWIRIFKATTNNLQFELNGSSVGGLSSNTIIQANTYYHIVVVVDSSNISLYVNGKLDKSVGNIVTFTWSDFNNASIGYLQQFGRYFNGQIDDTRIYNYALTQDQIKQIYNGGAINFGPSSGTP